MADKRQFRTIETTDEELDGKIRAYRLKIIKTLILAGGIILLFCAALFLFFRLREYDSYSVEKSSVREESVESEFFSFGEGFIKYNNDGAVYTDAGNELYWNQTYEMQDSMAEKCEGYVAFADKGGTEIYILNEAGLQGTIETPMAISKICVANQGTIAVWMENNGSNKIQLYDKNGKNLATGALYVENSGYPLDMALCNDAKKLAVSVLNVSGGEMKTSIKFYNFGSVGQNEIDNKVGSFEYKDVIIPQIEFVTNDKLVAFGDSKAVIFGGTQKPEPEEEIELKQEIKGVFCNEKYIGFISNNDEKAKETRHMEIYDTKGKHILSKDFSMDYADVEFLDNNEICIHNAEECLIYNAYGVKKFSYQFKQPLYKIISQNTQTNYIFILEGTTEKVRLK